MEAVATLRRYAAVKETVATMRRYITVKEALQ
jgi:hypothetical protein